jgi:undecaprenyl-diphosphatase
MLDQLIAFDKQLFVFLNGLGSKSYDALWLVITKQIYWAPLFLVVFVILQKKIGWKQLGILLLFIAFMILVSDQTANFFKVTFQRLRPCNDPEIMDVIRIVKASKTFGFFSAHASSSMASTILVFLLFKKHFKYPVLLFLFPIVFAYSRIYLGVHFPLDILAGYAVGIIYAFLFFSAHQFLQPKYFPSHI